MKITAKVSDRILRIKELNLFKWSSKGVIMTLPNKQILNLDVICQTERDNCLDLLESFLERDIHKQQEDDIKEVRQYLIDKYLL